MPTKADVIALAHRLIGVLSADEVPSADQDAFATDVLDALFEELRYTQGIPIAWTLASTPQRALMGLAETLASEIAPHYGKQYKPRSSGIARLRAALLSDDRTGAMDLGDAVVLTQGQASYFEYALYPTTVDLTGATVVFNLRDEYGTTVIDGASATVVTATGTPKVRYDFTTTNTRNVGRFRGDFQVTFADTTTATFPETPKIPVVITDPMGGSEDPLDALGDYF